MVRVNYMTRGGGRLSETAREPKTVRVLKPPGGGSSISFGDDPEPIRKPSTPAKPVEEKSPKETTPIQEVAKGSPAAVATSNEPPVTPEMTTPTYSRQRGRVPPGGFSTKLW